MQKGSLLLLTLLVAVCLKAEIITLPSSPPPESPTIRMATVQSIEDASSPEFILKGLGVPSHYYQHAYNTLALDGWTCQGTVQGSPLSLWQDPSNLTSMGSFSNSTLQQIRQSLLSQYHKANITLIVNLFGSSQLPVSTNQQASSCALSLKLFLQDYGFDGANLDFRDRAAVTSGAALPWLTEFLLAMGNDHKISITVEAALLDLQLGPDLVALEKALGVRIPFWVIRHSSTSYLQLYQGGIASVQQLAKRGIPIQKIVLEAPAQPWLEGYSKALTLLDWARKALNNLGWSAGFSSRPFAGDEVRDHMRTLITGRDRTVPVVSTTMDSINSWWPPEKTVAEMGVPSFSPDNDYNHWVMGTWTCKNGAFDVAKLWSSADYYLSHTFGNSSQQIQAFLKQKYLNEGKQIVVKAFGLAESPTSAKLLPEVCARKLAAFVMTNQLDGVQVHYMDNEAFNAGSAEQWLVAFTAVLRQLLPFHLLSHAIEDRYLHPDRFKGGSYSSVIKQVDRLLDFYPVVYYGQQNTAFSTYSELFINSGGEIPQSAASQLVSRGFQLNKIVVAKPVNLNDAQGAGFVEVKGLRPALLQASRELGWRGGVAYSSYLNDQDGNIVRELLRGRQKGPIYMSYLNNVKTWWPPQSTLTEMGAPTLAPPHRYNHLALAFWTCQAPKAMAKLYNDPLASFGTELGKDKQSIQTYIHSLYSQGGVSLMVSAFGDTEFPATAGYDPISCALSLAAYVLENGLDGADVDFQDSEAFRQGTGEPWLSAFTQELRMRLPFHIISHAPQAPYFSPSFSPKGAYRTLKTVFSNIVDFYNLQYYNQGNTTYETYSSLFLDSGPLNPDSAVFQLIGQGLRPQQVVLGKPVARSDAYNTGWVASEQLNSMLSAAVREGGGWRPNLMFWQYLSDLNGTVLSTAIKGF